MRSLDEKPALTGPPSSGASASDQACIAYESRAEIEVRLML